MLDLGRSIIGEQYLSDRSGENISNKLTNFIPAWSNLLLAWQNWYDELHASSEQSQDLLNRLENLKLALGAVQPVCSNLFPATLAMSNAAEELNELLVRNTHPLTH